MRIRFALIALLLSSAAAQAQILPPGAVPVTISTVGTTGVVTATLPAATSMTTFLCGFSIRANATAAVTGDATVTGTVSGTMHFTQWVAPTASGIGVVEPPFLDCIPGSSINTAIAVNSIAAGTAGVTSVTAWGYQKP